jgi:hypothetical protein
MRGNVLEADALCGGQPTGSEASVQTKACAGCVTEKNADIAFLFDESNSMKETEMKVQNEFAAHIAEHTMHYEGNDPANKVPQINFAFMDFSTRADIRFTFDNWKTKFTKNLTTGEYNIKEWFEKNDRRDHNNPPHAGPYGATGIINVLTEAKALFTNANLDPNGDKIAILITDGEENVVPYHKGIPKSGTEVRQLQEDAANALKALGVDLWVVGIGSQIDEVILKRISQASQSQVEHYSKIEGFISTTSEQEFEAFVVKLDTAITKVICPVPKDGEVTSQTWGSCSKTCGPGTQTKTYSCSAAEAGGCPCKPPTPLTKDCDLGCCIVRTVYGEWEKWGECTKACGGGEHTRTRTCVRDRFCPDTDTCPLSKTKEDGTCNTHLCDNWAKWEGWGPCQSECLNGVPNQGSQTRKRVCMQGTVVVPDARCGGQPTGSQPSVQSQSCTKVPAPKDGEVTSETWGSCSKTCGPGTQTKTYSCSAAEAGGCPCKPPTPLTKDCDLGCCIVRTVYGEWEKWGECTKACGGGEHTRTRTCVRDRFCPDTDTCPLSKTKEDGTCNTHLCDNWAKWEGWGPCQSECLNGVPNQGSQTRKRVCMQGTVVVPDARCGGQPTGSQPSVQSQSCTKVPAPKDGEVTSETWGSCSKTCGAGTQTKTYSCSTPEQGGCP